MNIENIQPTVERPNIQQADGSGKSLRREMQNRAIAWFYYVEQESYEQCCVNQVGFGERHNPQSKWDEQVRNQIDEWTIPQLSIIALV